ncbi:T9SS type A sorting domain-containing protein [bacterium SCSIO 12741]|nr:T9SS type A sorting domain-containing protein [bacterium SCSIO 12741]
MIRFIGLVGLFSLTITTTAIAQAPGNVSSNLLGWWKADAGITGSAPVTNWNDQSGNGNHLSSGSGPDLLTDDINFNDAVSFNGSSEYLQDATGLYGTSTYNHMFIYIINKTNTVKSSSVFREGLSGGDRFGSHLPWSNANVYYDHGTCCGSSRINTAWGTSTGVYHLWTLTSSTGTSTPSGTRKAIYRDGLSILTNDNNDGGTGNNSSFFLGASSASSSFHHGDVAECIIYNGVPSSTEQHQIHSYLAVKYGITLDQSTAQTYVSSSNTTIYASGSGGSHDGYDNDITGIGRDDNSALDQRKSMSINSDALIIMDKGGAFSNDEDFILWGNDNGSTALTTSQTHPSFARRVTRVWRADLTGSPGNVSVRFLLGSGIINTGNASDYALLLDGTDTDFSSGATAHTTGASLSGDTITFTGVSFTDGDFFTLGVDLGGTGPGGVISGILAWWKADVGLTGSSPVTAWSDMSGNGRDLSATNGPALQSNSINFNPALDFDGSDVFSLAGGLIGTSTYTDLWTYVVNQTDNVANRTLFYEDMGGSDRYGSHLVWGDSHIYYDFGTCCGVSRIYTNWGSSTGNYHVWSMGTSTGSSTPSGARKSIYRDGTLIASNNNNETGTGNSSTFYLGGSNTSGSHDGQVPEFVVFTSTPTTNELRQIESYFGIKYGLTQNHDYLSSSATTIWNATTNSEFHNDVAGIGRDDNSNLNQKQSISQNSDAIVTVALGAVASDNASNANTFSADESFLIWGNNNEALASDAIVDLPATIESRLARVWLASESGTVGTVRIRMDASGILGPSGNGTNDLNDVRLLVDADGIFGTGATLISPTSFDNSTDLVNFDVDFTVASGFYFTLGSVDYTNAPLPVELTAFTAHVIHAELVELNWVTASEINNDFFVVERSQDGKFWTSVTQVEGHGTSSESHTYQSFDSYPLPGTTYYRLVQFDEDGSSKIYPMVAVEIGVNETPVLYPNPASNRVYLSSAGMTEYLENPEIRLISTLGKVFAPNWTRDGDRWILDTQSIPDGLYFLWVRKNGQTIYQNELLIRH